MGINCDPSSTVQTGMYKIFYKWGHFVGRRPLLVILLSFALALLGSVRLIISPRFPMPAVVEQDELWVPQQAQAIDDNYLLQRYDGVIHLVTAADGADAHYKWGIVEDDSGGRVYRRETPAEAIEQDRKLQDAWRLHTKHVVVQNTSCGFQSKLETATGAVLAIAREAHPETAKLAAQLSERKRGSVDRQEH